MYVLLTDPFEIKRKRKQGGCSMTTAALRFAKACKTLLMTLRMVCSVQYCPIKKQKERKKE